jgi:hypothetical protein
MAQMGILGLDLRDGSYGVWDWTFQEIVDDGLRVLHVEAGGSRNGSVGNVDAAAKPYGFRESLFCVQVFLSKNKTT